MVIIMMKATTYSYCWAIRNELGRIAPVMIHLPDSDGKLTKERWFHFKDDLSGNIRIRYCVGKWQNFTPGIEIEGVRFHSAVRPIIDDYKRDVFEIEYEYV